MSEESAISPLPPAAYAALREARSAWDLSDDRKEVLGARLQSALHKPQAGAEQARSSDGALTGPAFNPLSFAGWKVIGVSVISLAIGWWGGASFSGEKSAHVTLSRNRTGQQVASGLNEREIPPLPAQVKSGSEVVRDARIKEENSPRNSPSGQVQQKPTKASFSFYEELSYLRRAQSALRDGNPALGLGLMLSLDEVKKEGALLSERRMTKVIALCALGRVDEARVIAAEILKGDSAQVYRLRLESSCVGTKK